MEGGRVVAGGGVAGEGYGGRGERWGVGRRAGKGVLGGGVVVTVWE